MKKPWFVYIARCADGTLYTGIATDVDLRIAAHDAGRGARYTRGRGPLMVFAQRRCKDKSEALRLEIAVKRLSKRKKLALAAMRNFRAFAKINAQPNRSSKARQAASRT